MARNFIGFFLVVFSALVILFGGYNCAQKIPIDAGRTEIPVDGNGGKKPTDGEKERERPKESLPEEETGDCNRKKYRELARKYGPYAFIDFHDRNLRDYRLGQESNYELGCPRIFLNMFRVEGSTAKIYEGTLSVAYEDADSSGKRVIKLHSYESGEGATENKFNNWSGTGASWNSVNPRVDFAAIFESSEAAVILHIDKVVRKDIGDGRFAYKGDGDVWFKMFRIFHNKKDVCYREGGYVSFARVPPPPPNKRCWLLDVGPYSCLPQGINTIRRFNLRGSLTCYKKLGHFKYLDIKEAFNLESGENHP